MRLKLVFCLLVVFVFSFEAMLQAQPGRGGRARISRTALAQVEAVQKELEVTDDQLADLEELRGNRRQRGEGEGRGEGRRQRGEGGEKGAGEGGEKGGGKGEGRGQGRQRRQRGEGGGPGQARTIEQVQAEIDSLAEVLLPQQMTRLEEIYIQALGARALQDPVIASELEISEDQIAEMQEIQNAAREQMADMRENTDREQRREQMAEVNSETNESLMAVLTDDQQNKLDEMKGEAFELPEDALRGGRGRGRQRSDF